MRKGVPMAKDMSATASATSRGSGPTRPSGLICVETERGEQIELAHSGDLDLLPARSAV